MAEHVDTLRNIALAAHSGAGKTALAEAMLFNAGVTTRLGRVEDGNTVMDFEPEELKRQSSISTAFHSFEWEKKSISLMDTPGDMNFFTDTKLCMQAADGVVLVVDAIDGVKVQTEKAWEFADTYGLPRAIFINKLDRERADFDRTLQDVSDCFSAKPIVLQLPIGKEETFNGIVDLVAMKAFTYENGKSSATDIPADMQGAVDAAREAMVENIAEADDDLLERYLEGETLSDDELQAALRRGILNRDFVPVVCGSATLNIGADLFSDFVVACMPSPADRGAWSAADPAKDEAVSLEPDPDAPFAGFVFKTVADPYAGRLSIFGSFPALWARRQHLQHHQEQQGALQPAADHCRQGAKARAGRRPGRHRGGGQAQGNHHRRHPLRRHEKGPVQLRGAPARP
jgi:elongation factor G